MDVDFDSSKIIFIGGAPRSGTTLVQRIVGSHSLVFGGPEFDLIPSVMKLRNSFHASVTAGRISTYLNHDDVDSLFRGFVESAFKKVIQENPGKRYLSEKTPSNAEVFREIAETFPKSKLILVIRDPRAVVASMLKVGERFRKEGRRPNGFTKNVREAIHYLNRVWDAASHVITKDNVLIVFYEDIVLNPHKLIPDIAEKLGLVFEDRMIEIEKQRTITSEFKNAEHLWYSKEKLQSAIDSQSLEKWKEQLTAYELFVIDKRLNRIEGVTNRYHLNRPSNPLFLIKDFIGSAVFEAKELFGKIGRKVYARL